MAHAQDNPIGGIDEGDPLEIRIDEQTIGKLREVTTWALNSIKVEMKAQRLADAHGAYGWRTVKGIFCRKKLANFSIFNSFRV